ncbi:ribonuclease III [Chamaesiphon sp.]|uniref:ribonuclease III n=1 Tax=Chamaesiphon sp. TaxID=2814140 RepID=UPI00359377A8
MHKLLLFSDEKLLRQALTHRSYAHEHPDETSDNERLEFFGDAILTFISGEYLYLLHPEMGEDEMTRRRAALVEEKQLAKFANEVGLDFRMRLGEGLIRAGGYHSANLLSSTFEAVVGAYYLDKGCDLEAIRPLIHELFDAVPQVITATRSTVDPKNQFQAFVQANGAIAPPKYITEKKGGSDHSPEFVSKVYVGDKFCGEGKGLSKKDAEKQAAKSALATLKKGNS